MAHADRYDHVVINEDIAQAISKIEAILEDPFANE